MAPVYRPHSGWTRPTYAILTALLAACHTDATGLDFSCLLGCGIPPQPTVTVVGPSQRAGWDTVAVGATIQLTATFRDVNGAVLTGRTFQWTSEDVAKAKVTSSGLVTALGTGRVQITATAMPDRVVGWMTIDILPGPTGSISATEPASLRQSAVGRLPSDSASPELLVPGRERALEEDLVEQRPFPE